MIDLADRNIKERSAIVDFRLMPRGQCDLNFRHARLAKGQELLSLWLLTAGFKTACVAALVWMIREFTLSLTLMAGLGIAIGVSVSVTHYRRGSSEIRIIKEGGVAFVLGPIVAGLASVFLRQPPHHLVTGLLFFGFLPLMIRAADQIAQHAAWWVTANPRASHRTMTIGRILWKDRFWCAVQIPDLVQSKLQRTALERLRTGFGFCFRSLIFAVSTIWGLQVALKTSQPDSTQRFLGTIFSIQLFVLLVNCALYPRAVQGFCKILKHWCFRDVDRLAPPVVWRSPSGISQHRRWQLLIPLFVLGIVVAWFELNSVMSNGHQTPRMILLLVVRYLAIIAALPLLVVLGSNVEIMYQSPTSI